MASTTSLGSNGLRQADTVEYLLSIAHSDSFRCVLIHCSEGFNSMCALFLTKELDVCFCFLR